MRPGLTPLIGILLATNLAACGQSEVELVVDLRTDLLAGTEFRSVRVILDPGGSVDTPMPEGDFIEGVRIAELTGLTPGSHDLFVTLFDLDGDPFVEQRIRVQLERDTAMTVLITRDCTPVSCSAEQRCLSATCVSRDCSELDRAACGAPACSADADCVPAVTCAEGRCLDGACFFQEIPLSCDELSVCHPETGCIDPPLVEVEVEGWPYRVASGYVLDAPYGLAATSGRNTLIDRAATITFPRDGTTFLPNPYIGLDGDGGMVAPLLVRMDGRGLPEFIALSIPPDGPDERFTQMAFADPASGYGDLLYLVSSSAGDGDGLFTVSDTFVQANVLPVNNAQGMVFDHGSLIGDPGFATPLYVAFGTSLERIAPDGARATVNTLPDNETGWPLYLPPPGPFQGYLWLVSPGDNVDGDGVIARIATPNAQGPVETWQSGLPDPAKAGAVITSGSMGDRLYVSLMSSGELRSYRVDGSYKVVVEGLRDPRGVAWDGEAVYVLERGLGAVLRVRRL